MEGKCTICSEAAIYVIKDTNDYYCKDCAIECFSDVSFLQKIEEKARELKKFIKDEIEDRIE